MAKEFVATFTLENQSQTANFSIEEHTIDASFSMKPGERDHENLYNRDKEDQHPINAITGLTEIIEDLQNNKDKYSEFDIDTEDETGDAINQGQPGNSYEFEQAVTEKTWIIHHNLNKKPSVTVVDEYDRVIVPEIRYKSNNEIELTFNFAFKGKAYLN